MVQCRFFFLLVTANVSMYCSPSAGVVVGMSPRFDEMEAGGVGAVHRADRRTAVQRNGYVRFACKKVKVVDVLLCRYSPDPAICSMPMVTTRS